MAGTLHHKDYLHSITNTGRPFCHYHNLPLCFPLADSRHHHDENGDGIAGKIMGMHMFTHGNIASGVSDNGAVFQNQITIVQRFARPVCDP